MSAGVSKPTQRMMPGAAQRVVKSASDPPPAPDEPPFAALALIVADVLAPLPAGDELECAPPLPATDSPSPPHAAPTATARRPITNDEKRARSCHMFASRCEDTRAWAAPLAGETATG